jgi:hypothetical protein
MEIRGRRTAGRSPLGQPDLSRSVGFGNVGLGSHPAVPLASRGRLLSDVKLKQQVQELTFGLEGRLAQGKRPYSAAASGGRV